MILTNFSILPLKFVEAAMFFAAKSHALIRVKGYILSHVEVIILPESLQHICAGCRIKFRTKGLVSYFMLSMLLARSYFKVLFRIYNQLKRDFFGTFHLLV